MIFPFCTHLRMFLKTARTQDTQLAGFYRKGKRCRFRFVYILSCYCQQVIFEMSRCKRVSIISKRMKKGISITV